MFSPGAFFGAGRKTVTKMSKAGGRGGKAKSIVQPLQPAREKDESASDESVQVVSPPSVTLRSPPPVPCMVYDNQPNRVGSKPSNDQPQGRFLPSPNKTFFNTRAQLEFDDLHTCQHLSPVTLVRRDVQQRRTRLRLTPMSFSENSKLTHTIAVRAVKQMGQTVALQACFNESFDKEDFMRGLIEKAKDINKKYGDKKVV